MSDQIHLPETNEPLRDAIRRLRWFRAALDRQLDDLRAETGLTFTVDDKKLEVGLLERPESAQQRRAALDLLDGRGGDAVGIGG